MVSRLIGLWALVMIVTISADIQAAEPEVEPEVRLFAPGYGELAFTAPPAGSYRLPILNDAKNSTVLNATGQPIEFHQLFEHKYTLLSFMYTRCNDINGCPLTNVVFNRIRHQLRHNPELSNKLQFISMSFDPDNDTPEVIKAVSDVLNGHANHHQHSEVPKIAARADVEWLHLTAASEESLRPILNDYNQGVLKRLDASGKSSGNFSHILRVYLIDDNYKIRNIYSVSFLHPDIIINDVKTLLLEKNTNENQQIAASGQSDIHWGPGDNKQNYQSSSYTTRSVSIKARVGQPTDLLSLVQSPPLGLPKVPVPNNNKLSTAKIALGKRLFFDRRLSLNNTISCAMCHIPEQGFTNNELKTPVGFEGRSVRRNAPTLYNIAYFNTLHHDSRETSLENQIWQPLLAANEMAMPSLGWVVQKLVNLSDYQGLFEQVFNGAGISVKTIGQAIASYERTLLAADSAFDRWYFGQQKNAISLSAQRGFSLFTGKAQCSACHQVNNEYALFIDQQLHNTGVGWHRSMKKAPKFQRIQIAPGTFVNVKQSVIKKVSQGIIGDLGYYELTQDPADRWRYRTPTLRNISLTAPYMHDGSLSTLAEVVAFYNQGGIENDNLSPLIKPLNLTKQESADLVSFLTTLTASNIETLVSDAFAVPIGDVD